MSFKTIIVFGSTGKQGSATVKVSPPDVFSYIVSWLTAPQALNAIGGYNIIAATRDTESDRAKALAQTPNVRVVKGEVGDHAHLFKDSVHGIFFFLVGFDIEASIERGKCTLSNIPGASEPIEFVAKGMLDTAVSKGVQHVIFSGVDFCGHREKGIRHPLWALIIRSESKSSLI